MKLSVSRNMLILTVVGVALLAFTVLMMVFYFGAVSKTSQLESDIKDLQRRIAAVDPVDIPGLKQQLADVQDQIENDAPFPAGPFDAGSKYDNKQVTNALFEVTDDAYVDLDSLTHSKGSTTKIGKGTYRTDPYVMSCSVEAMRGERLISLLELLEELREDEYPTLVVDGLKFSFPEGEAKDITLNFNLVIITQTLPK